ncbi:MAG: 50S ribosomal protein L30 [Candidatus Nanoarchaeia archaeon]|nr:50S ribosomal protein L30 [Candidatus Nanoarchaeia archaeon]
MSRLAVIQVRGGLGMKKPIKDTLNLLRIYKKNSCAVVSAKPSYIGMLELIKDFVTWGEIDKETFKLLLLKRGRLPGNQPLTEEYIKKSTNLTIDQFAEQFVNDKKELKDIPGLKSFFRLTPPVKGFENKGVKRPFSMGGALGYRKEKINELIQRML